MKRKEMEEKMNNSPRVLIVSNSEFNLSVSNGRVLGTLLVDIPNDCKLQFCVNGTSVSSSLIENCYRISDNTVLRGVLKNHIHATKLQCDVEPNRYQKKTAYRKRRRTASKMLGRDLLWRFKLNKLEFIELAKTYKPDVILWQYGDSGFMADLVRRLSKVCNARIVVYTTEDYYFKQWDYFQQRKAGLICKLFFSEMRKSTKRLFELSPLCVANTPLLAQQFSSEFGCETHCIMQPVGATIDEGEYLEDDERERVIIYAGNFSVGRPSSLALIAETLKKIDSTIRFEIYGKANEDTVELFKQYSNIDYMGFTSYEKITLLTRKVLLNVHAESFDKFFEKDVRAAFSTKISDALVAGTPLFVFAPLTLAETSYLNDNKAAIVCNSTDSLYDSLRRALFDEKFRKDIVKNAKTLASVNHDSKNNSIKMRRIIYEAANIQ